MMDNSILMTIVVPTFNMQNYLRRCLDSLIVCSAMTKKMEVLVINDGSTDESSQIAHSYQDNYPETFRVIDKENGGHGSVWNLGVKEAQGKYLRFLDSDDWLENLDLLIERLTNCDADLVLTHTMCHCPGDKLWKQEILDMEFGRVYDADSFDWLHNRSHRNFVLHHSCTYKAEILRQYLPLFLEKQPYDDMILSPSAIIGSHSLVAYDFVLYHYLMDREGQSISVNVRNKNMEAMTRSQQSVIDFVEKHHVPVSSSKYTYFRFRLPMMYNYGYKVYLNLRYKEAKRLTKAWDHWTMKRNPSVQTKWISLYRILPFVLYWRIGRLLYK